jgi:hypothetical protein
MKRIEAAQARRSWDPLSELKWTHKAPEKIANEWNAESISVCENTVAKLINSLKTAS